jgi:hypothetical protein
MGGFLSRSEPLPEKYADAINNYMRFTGYGFYDAGTSSGEWCSYEEWKLMDYDMRNQTMIDFIEKTYHPKYMEWHYQITNSAGLIAGQGTLYHEEMCEPIVGHSKLLQSWIADRDHHKSYVSPFDGSNASFNLKNAVKSVKIKKVNKLDLFSYNYYIPKTTKTVTIVRWAMNTIPHGKDHRSGSDFEVISMFDTDTGLVLQNKFFLGLDFLRKKQHAAEIKAKNEAYMNFLISKQPKVSREEIWRDINRITHKNCTTHYCLHPSFDSKLGCTGGKS